MLSQPNCDLVYIGSTKNLKERLNGHKASGTLGGISVDSVNMKIESIEMVDEQERYYWERFYIELMKQWGFKLANTRSVCVTQKKWESRGDLIVLTKKEKQQISKLIKRGDYKRIANRFGYKYGEVAKSIKAFKLPPGMLRNIKRFYGLQ